MSIQPVLGRPGVSAARVASLRHILRGPGSAKWFPGGGTIDGAKARDPLNTDNPRLLRAGLPMGRASSGTLKKWANSFFGVTQGAYVSGNTTITVTAAQAAEIVRRVGTSGALNFIGPPTAAGTVAVTQQNFSAVNTGTGVITITSLGVDKIAGTLIAATDGTQIPRSLIGDGQGVLIPENSADVDYPHLMVGGDVDASQVIFWPTDTSLQQWIVDSLNANGYGRFPFDHLLGPA